MTFTPPEQTTRKKRAFQGKIYHCLGKTPDAITGQEEIGYEYFQDGILVLDENGTIQVCGEKNEIKSKLDLSGYSITVLPDSQMILPGLIDLHVHLPQLNVTARQEDDLLNWLERHIFAEEMKFSDAVYARQVSDLFFKSLLSNGTTTACVFLTSHKKATEIAFESAKTWGNRAVMGLNLMDRNAPKALTPPVNTLMADTEALCQKWHGAAEGRLQYAWMPRFALSCSEVLLSGIGKLRRQYPEVYLHTHISEQLNEIDAVKQSFPWAKHYTDVYAHYGLLGPRTILAHGVHLEDIELDCLLKHEAGVAHCPSSNLSLIHI